MSTSSRVGLIVVALVVVVGAVTWSSRGKVLDYAADEVVNKFQTLNCEQLKTQKDEPPTLAKKVALGLLSNDEKARVAFIDRIAAPVLNKMIECGLAP